VCAVTGTRRDAQVMVSLDRGEIWIRDEDSYLTPGELRILRMLKRREGRPVPAEILAAQVCDDPAGYGCASPKHHISSLRRKLRHSEERPVIATRRGLGYYLVEGSLSFSEGEE